MKLSKIITKNRSRKTIKTYKKYMDVSDQMVYEPYFFKKVNFTGSVQRISNFLLASPLFKAISKNP